MKITADYHVHSNFSGDSQSSMDEMIQKAISLGLTHICFTDHMDYDYPKQYLGSARSFEFNVDKYFKHIEKMQEKYKEIKVLAGIELGVRPYLADKLNNLVEGYPFDFVIASSHLVEDFDPYFPDYWEYYNNDPNLGIMKYFDSIIENIQVFHNFDTYGHLDYIIRYVPNKSFTYDPKLYWEQIERLLLTLVELNKGIEVNTAGLKYGLPFAHPKVEILKKFIELGGSYITIGSDGHKPEHLAFDFNKEADILKNMGIQQYAIFEKRKPFFVQID